MTVSVWEQAYSLLGGLLLGVATGLLYELLRCVRYRVRGHIFCALLDLVFWLSVTAALFLWSVAAGRGVVQLSICAALFLGCAGYLHFLSPLCFPAFFAFTGLIARLLGLLTAPVRLLGRMGEAITKKFTVFFKKHFPFPEK